MFARVCRLVAVAAVALQLGACINSDYDIAASLAPEFSIKPGAYAKADGTVMVVRKVGDAYKVYNRRAKETTYVRLFKVPEFSDYVLQYYDRKQKPIVYLFLKPTDKGFDVYDIEKLASVLPDHVAKLLAPVTESDRRDNNVTVVNGKRDTLYVVRELARANPKMIAVESYERRP
jgi:hypothetical protein